MRVIHRLLALVVVSAAGAAGLLAASPPAIEFEPYTFESYTGEKVEAELGRMTVPENRSKPDSRTIELRFVRFASTARKPGAPIVYLAGGPGGSGTGTATYTRFPLFMALRAFGDVIAFDQRGTGMSGPDLSCNEPYMLPLDRPVDRAEAGTIIGGAVARCMERLRGEGVDLNGYNTRESAADLDDLRRGLGSKKLTLWGISYGTHLALAYMKEYGAHTDRAILAGLEGLHHSYKLPSDQQKLIEQIATLARANPAIAAATPDLLGSIAAIFERIEKDPPTVSLTHPANGMTSPISVGKFELQVAFAGMLRGPESFAGLPDIVSRLENGDWTLLALAAAQHKFGNAGNGMSLAMDCASGASKPWLERIAAEAGKTLLGDAINFPFPDVCPSVGVEDLGDKFREPLRSAVPTLLISGTLDGRTPVSNGEEVMRGLSEAQHLIIDGAGHSDPLFLSSPEILESMQAFLDGKPIRKTRIQLPAIEFLPPRKVVTLTTDELSQLAGTYRINDEETRSVMLAGSILYTRRGNGQPLPIRPTSKNEFFYEGQATRVQFERDADGAVTGMVLYEGASQEGEHARKID